MSAEYDNYLKEHIDAVMRAASWMVFHLDAAFSLSNTDIGDFILNVRRHDRSKYLSIEYVPYDAYFYGKKDVEAFNKAWLHHIHLNPHHWQHWVLVHDDGAVGSDGKAEPIEMPKVHALEMVADWWSFSWRSGKLDEVFGWYEEHKDGIILHPSTRAYVESVLAEIRQRIEED